MGSQLARATRPTLAVLAAAAALASGACASGGGAREGQSPATETVGAQTPQRVDVRTMGQASGTTFAINPTAVEANATPIAATPVESWAALTWAYNELKLNPDVVNSPAMTIGLENARLRNSLGGKPMSWYIDCGMGPSGPIANAYEMILTMRSQVKPLESTSQLLTVISATARPVAVSGSLVNCSSTGALEKRIAEMVAGKATRK